jgi:alpha-beta hydrolase superfamily lysophospholipase
VTVPSGPERNDTLVTTDGIVLHGREWPALSPRAVVVLAHGFAGSTVDAAVVRQAEALQAEGVNVVCYDSRGHGRSGGVCTMGYRETRDVAAAVELAETYGLPVVLVGASMGAVAALRYAARGYRQLAGVVAMSAPACWRKPHSAQGLLLYAATRTTLGRRVAQRYPAVRVGPWQAPGPPIELVGRIAIPLAIIHGDRDRYIPVSDAEQLYRACSPFGRRLEVVVGMGHAFDAKALPAVKASVEWLLADEKSPRPPVEWGYRQPRGR